MKALYRAKRIDNGEWAYGNLIERADGNSLIYIQETDEMVMIDAKTACPYIGINDNNDVQIFQGDIVVDVSNCSGLVTSECAKRIIRANEYQSGVVQYCTNGDVGSCGCCYEYFVGAGFKVDGIDLTNCCVAGNIHDNPELVTT